jgi:signal transduction histidine kinase
MLRSDGVVIASSRASEVGHPAGAHAKQVRADGDVISSSAGNDPDVPAAVHTVQPFPNRAECQSCHAKAGPVIGFLDLDIAVNPHMIGLTTFTSLSALLGLLYLVAVVGVAGPLIGVVIGRPVRRLINAMQQVEAGDLSTRLEPTGTSEIDAVFSGFNNMSEQLRLGRAAEEEARRLQLERVEQLASVGELAAGLAHEIRNPLSGVKAVVEVVARDTTDPSRRSVLHDAAGELARIDQIVRQLLQYARPKKPVLTAFDLNLLVRDALNLARPGALGPDNEHTRCELASDLPPVLGDAAQIRQVLINLLLNAEQAAGPEGRVAVGTGRTDATVWCRVRDSGPGVPADRADAIFRPFVTSKARGTGLGLSISSRIIELQGGTLVLENPGEPGASFSFSLPIASA